MGLYVSCYYNLEQTKNKNGIYIGQNSEEDWQHKCQIPEGYYTADEYENYISYSYSSHYNFRNNLCIPFGYTFQELCNDSEKYKNQPFYELTWFSDCEGYLDYVICGILLEDFEKYEEFIKTKISEQDYLFWGRYFKWKDICKFCFENKGVLIFS